MGVCCDKTDTNSPKRNRTVQAGPISAIDQDLNNTNATEMSQLLSVENLMSSKRRMTAAEVAEQERTMLSFKDKMKFKTVQKFP